jgi:hypothetical protein
MVLSKFIFISIFIFFSTRTYNWFGDSSAARLAYNERYVERVKMGGGEAVSKEPIHEFSQYITLRNECHFITVGGKLSSYCLNVTKIS